MYWSSFEPNSGTRAPDVHTVQAAVSKMETIKSSEPTRTVGQELPAVRKLKQLRVPAGSCFEPNSGTSSVCPSVH